MGTVTELDPERAARAERLADIALAASMHPALRWTAGADASTGHRRTPLGHAVCGAPGDLLIADRGLPRCDQGCYDHLPGTGT
jgi:hypothetical protein